MTTKHLGDEANTLTVAEIHILTFKTEHVEIKKKRSVSIILRRFVKE